MTESEFRQVCNECVNELRRICPRDTGNLANDGIRFIFLGDKKCVIYVDDEIAPYMVYTNEPWVSDYWNRKRKDGSTYKLKNPNEGWWQTAYGVLVDLVLSKLEGTIKND